MKDSGFQLSPAQRERLVQVHRRKAYGSLEPIAIDMPPSHPEFWSGGGALYSTGPDYLAFLRMLLGGGRIGSTQLLRPETVAQMGQNQVGDLAAGAMRTMMPERTNDFVLFPEGECRWGLAYMINTLPGPNGRAAGSLSWGGIFNSYYWIDPAKCVAAVLLTQLLPFADPSALALYGAFERETYALLGSR
jgi:CubicO group peptidase (beta-lactamase class C family)